MENQKDKQLEHDAETGLCSVRNGIGAYFIVSIILRFVEVARSQIIQGA